MNGRELSGTGVVLKPLDHPYEAALGEKTQYACFTVKRSLVREGINHLTIALDDGGPVTIEYIDLLLP